MDKKKLPILITITVPEDFDGEGYAEEIRNYLRKDIRHKKCGTCDDTRKMADSVRIVDLEKLRRDRTGHDISCNCNLCHYSTFNEALAMVAGK